MARPLEMASPARPVAGCATVEVPLLDPLLAVYLACGWLPWAPAADSQRSARDRLAVPALRYIEQLGPHGLGCMPERALTARLGWFMRLLDLLPSTARDHWLAIRVAAAEGHPIAAIGPHEGLTLNPAVAGH